MFQEPHPQKPLIGTTALSRTCQQILAYPENPNREVAGMTMHWQSGRVGAFYGGDSYVIPTVGAPSALLVMASSLPKLVQGLLSEGVLVGARRAYRGLSGLPCSDSDNLSI